MNDAEQQLPVDILNHLDNVDLTKVDRSFPLLKEGTYVAVIDGFETKENNARTGHNLNVKLRLDQEAVSTEGKKLNKGFPINDLISLVPTERYNPLERLADIQLAALGKQQKGFKFGDYIGRRVTIRVKIEESDTYGDRNRIARWIQAQPEKVASL